MSEFSNWCPAGATDPGSEYPGDLGDFGDNEKPPHDSQKNLVFMGYDPRTRTLLSARGGFGAFAEDPPTPMEIIRSTDCGKTWDLVAEFENYIEDRYGEGIISSGDLYTIFFVPTAVVPGTNPGDWILFDYCFGYYVSTDNGVTWSARQYGGLDGGVESLGGTFFRYFGLMGGVNFLEPAHIPVVNNMQGAMGASYVDIGNFGPPRFGLEGFGLRRTTGPNGSGGWVDSLPPTPTEFGGSGWVSASTPVFPLGFGNGRWIWISDYPSTNDGYDDEDENFQEVRTPNVRINTNPNLDTVGWQTPFWLVSEAWCQDTYGGTVGGVSSDLRLEFREPTAPTLKYIPIVGHPAGGRWWLFGLTDSVVYSDDGGETWSNSLADHTGPEENMHPFLNWRKSHALTTRLSHTTVMNIIQDPFDGMRQISVGITYDREGITNRLAVFSCSIDGGNTWGPVGQLPITAPVTAPGGIADRDRVGIARHAFPCFTV